MPNALVTKTALDIITKAPPAGATDTLRITDPPAMPGTTTVWAAVS